MTVTMHKGATPTRSFRERHSIRGWGKRHPLAIEFALSASTSAVATTSLLVACGNDALPIIALVSVYAGAGVNVLRERRLIANDEKLIYGDEPHVRTKEEREVRINRLQFTWVKGLIFALAGVRLGMEAANWITDYFAEQAEIAANQKLDEAYRPNVVETNRYYMETYAREYPNTYTVSLNEDGTATITNLSRSHDIILMVSRDKWVVLHQYDMTTVPYANDVTSTAFTPVPEPSGPSKYQPQFKPALNEISPAAAFAVPLLPKPKNTKNAELPEPAVA